MSINNQHKILIITAPSGAGKTSITRHLMQQFPQLAFSPLHVSQGQMKKMVRIIILLPKMLLKIIFNKMIL
jgi:uridine kinase